MADFTALKTAITNAIKQNGNQAITGNLLQEILIAMVESMGDTALNGLATSIQTSLNSLSAEDDNLANAISSEANTRQSADNTLSSAINSEVSARENADATLQQGFNLAINSEALTRYQADTALQQNINNEAVTRQSADTILQNQITAEKNVRVVDISRLQGLIDAINAIVGNGYTFGGIATINGAPQQGKMFYIALERGNYINYGGVSVHNGITLIYNNGQWISKELLDLDVFYGEILRIVNAYQPIVIEGNVTNAPDEEDLTSNNIGLLQFKNKAYAPTIYSGLGRKYLRKNIRPRTDSASFDGFVENVESEASLSGTPDAIFWDRINERFVGKKDDVYYQDWTDSDDYVPVSSELVYMNEGTPYRWDGAGLIVYDEIYPDLINMLTQEMISDVNTIYHIQYDFTLGEDMTIPENCVLEFDGGSISGAHTLTGNNTGIQAGLLKIFNTDVIPAGTWKANAFYPEWFGAKGDNITDDTDAFQALAAFVTAMGSGKIYITNKTYLITEAIFMKGNIELCGCGKDSVLHLGNSSTGIHIGEVNDYVQVDAYLTDGDGTIAGKDANNDDVTCKCTVKGDMTIKVSDASKFTKDEIYVIQDLCDFSFENSRAYYRQGEIIRVRSVDTDNNTITLYNGLYGVYGNDLNFEGYVAGLDGRTFTQRFVTSISGYYHRTIFFKFNYKQINIHDFKIISDGDNTSTVPGYYGLYICNIINSKIDSIECISNEGSHVALRLDGAFNSSITNSRIISDFTNGGDFYGCSLGDIQDFIVSDCVFGGRAHSLATGSKSWEGAIINRNFIYERLTFEPLVENIIVLDVHAGAELYTYRDICSPYKVCDTGGYYVTIENCHFDHISTSFFNSGMTIRNCVLEGNSDVGVSKLLNMNNPWHDYSNDDIIIENCKFLNRGVNFDGQVSKYSINNLIIRNNVITCVTDRFGINGKCLLFKKSFIENNDIYNKYTSYSSIIAIYQLRVTDSYIFVRNNNIYGGGMTIGSFDNILPASPTYNDCTQTKVIIENNYIKSPDGTNAGEALYAAYCNAIIKNNVIKAKTRHIYINTAKGLVENNIIKNVTGNPIYNLYYSNSFGSSIAFAEFTVKNNFNLKGFEIKNIDVNKITIPSGASLYKPLYNLNITDIGLTYQDTTLDKIITFTAKKTDVKLKSGNLDTEGIFVSNDLENGVIYSWNAYRRTQIYLSKVNSNPTDDDLLYLGGITSNSWASGIFKNNSVDYPYFYIVTTTAVAQYYLGKVVYWTESDGATAGVARSGITANRPLGSDIYIGFKYMDITLGKPIFANAISEDTVTWVDATGNPV